MRKLLLVLLLLVTTVTGCDPHFDSYVKPLDRKECNPLNSNISITEYKKCLRDLGYTEQRDPLSGFHVYYKD